MNSGLEAFSKEQITYCSGTLEFDTPVLEISARQGETYRGYFQIQVHAQQDAIGYVRTTDYRVRCSERKFRGKNLEVPFTFDTLGMECADTVKGEFYIISNMGEYYLPYEVTIAGAVINSELGEIKNLFHFANLAKTNWQEALVCFYAEEFAQILTGSAKQYREAYRAFREMGLESGQKEFAMEQFLILIKKKQPVTFEYPQTVFSYSREDVPDTIEIPIRRNGWGYTNLTVQSEGGFLQPLQSSLQTEDFSGGEAVISIAIHKKAFHTGKNIGTVCLEAKDERQLCQICVEVAGKSDAEQIAERQSKQLTDCMMRLYLDYRTGRKPPEESVAAANSVLEQVRGRDALMPALYQAHLKLLTGQINEADWLLRRARRMIEGKEMPLPIYGYFLYLTAMSGGEERVRAGELLQEYAEQYPDEFVIYWGYMHKEKQNRENPGTVYRKLKEFGEKGCFQPVLYLEAAMIILKDPMLLTTLDAFEVQMLLFMERYALIPQSLGEQIYDIAEKGKTYYPMLMPILDKYPPKERRKRVKVMCLQYMRGGCRDEHAAEWLREGILSDCRITGLYEAYIRARRFDKKEELPSEVVRYFAYDTSLDAGHLAYVYAMIIRQQEKLSVDYEARIRNFVMKELLAGKIDDNLAYLYRNVLMPEDMIKEAQEQLLSLAFTYELVTEQTNCKCCIVRHTGVVKQEKFLFKGNRALLNIYADDYTLLLEDEEGLCYPLHKDYELHPLLGYERMKRLLHNCDKTTFEEQFHWCSVHPVEAIEEQEEFEAMYPHYRWLLEREELSEEFCRELAGKLLHAYNKWNLTAQMDEFLQHADAEDFAGKDRMEFVTLLCMRGFYDKAFTIASTYGYEKVDDKILARLCQFVIESAEGRYDKTLVKLVYRVFDRGKYTETMISYLAEWFEGTVKQMRNIWKAAVAMDVSAAAIAERILSQLVFAGAYTSDREKIFQYYCRHDGRKALIKDYLFMRSEEYLVRDEEVEDGVFEELQKNMLEGEEFPLGAGLALLKYNSMQTCVSEEKRALCIRLLGESLGADVYFPYYQAFADIYPVLEVYGEKSYVECRTKAGNKVTIHYILDRPGTETGIYCHEQMTEIYPGIFQKDFRLFWGEILQYYITEEQEDEDSLILSGSLERAETMEENGHGRFHLLNDIALAMELRDYDTADSLAEEYIRNGFITAGMLRIK